MSAERNLYVSRSENWNNRTKEMHITEEEWIKFIENDVDLIPIDNNYKTVGYLGEPIYWVNGEIYCVDPDEAAFYKMLNIANTIDGILYGNDGRQYFSINSYFYSDNASHPEPPLLRFEKDKLNRNRPWWKKVLNIDAVK